MRRKSIRTLRKEEVKMIEGVQKPLKEYMDYHRDLPIMYSTFGMLGTISAVLAFLYKRKAELIEANKNK